MSSKLDICNLAISHIAVGKEITDFDNDQTEAGRACRLFYDTARQKLLRDFDWPFANTIGTLTLVEDDPTIEWGFSYRYPADALEIRRILNGATRVDTSSSRAQYSIGRDVTGRLIYADVEDAELQYTYNEIDPTKFTADFVLALSFYLAFLIGPRITSGGQVKELADRAYVYYQRCLLEAKANAANEEPRDNPPDADLILERL